MGTGTGCTVWANGERVADGSPGDDPLAPTALSGLAVTWGRDNTVDQPATSTASFDLVDAPGGPSFAGVFQPGTPVEVTATGTSYPAPATPTFLDPGFEAGPANATATVRARLTRTGERVSSGAYSTRIDPTSSSRWSTVLAPAPFAPYGTDPAAWDGIIATGPGQSWQYGARVWIPAGVVVVLAPVLFPEPYAESVLFDSVHSVTAGGGPAGGWHDMAGHFGPELAGAWVGLAVSAYPVSVTWDAAAGTFDAAAGTWDAAGAVFVDDVAVMAPAGPLPTSVLVYAGRVTGLELVYDDGSAAPMLRVTCADFTADLGNTSVGDEPWLVEPMRTRFERVLTLAGLAVNDILDASIAGELVTWRDVDRQPAIGLLRELAASVDGICWSATHSSTGAYLHVEDPRNRPPAYVLAKPGPLVVIISTMAGMTQISACEVEREPVSWAQDVQDISTRVEVTWLLQGVDDDGLPTTTEQTVTLEDIGGQAAFGVRAYSLSSQLQSAPDATRVASYIAERTRGGWRASGLALDDDDIEAGDPAVARLLRLLDGTTRNGQGIALADLPEWAPGAPTAGLYLEGGTYTFEAGRWVLALNVSSAQSQGHSVTWDDLTAAGYTWDQFDPGIAWDDLAGVGPPAALEAA